MSAFPLRLGSDAEFAALRTTLLSAGYTEPAICARFQKARISGMYAEGTRDLGDPPSDPLGILARLLLENGPVSTGSLPADVRESLDALGLTEAGADRVEATVMLYPTRGLYIASDRVRPPDKPGPPPDDIVYSAIVPNTELFLDLAPWTPCDAFLDLCAGTGIAALVAGNSGARRHGRSTLRSAPPTLPSSTGASTASLM
jgi:hypothetical protein